MKKRHFRLGLVVMAAFLLVFELCFGGGISTADGLTMAIVAPGVVSQEGVSTQTSKEASPDLIVNAIEKSITEMAPDRAPLTTFLSHIPDSQVRPSLRVDYYAVDYRGSMDVTNAAITAADNATLELPVDNYKMWGAGDTGILKGIPYYDATTNLVIVGSDMHFYVYDLNRETKKIKIQSLNGKVVGDVPVFADDIASGTEVIRIAPGGSEETVTVDPYADMPEKSYNLMQKFVATIEQTHWNEIVDKEVDWGWSDYSRRQLMGLKMDQEKAFFLNKRFEFEENKEGEKLQLTGGALDFVTGLNTTLKDASTMTNKVYSDLCKDIFSGNGGSAQRLVFCGDDYMSQLGESTPIQKQLSAKNSEVKFGITYNKITSNFGEMLLLRAPMLNEVGMRHMALSVDINNLAMRHLENTRVIDVDYAKQGKADKKGKSVIKTSCVLFKYPDTHKWLEGKS